MQGTLLTRNFLLQGIGETVTKQLVLSYIRALAASDATTAIETKETGSASMTGT